MRVIFDGDIFVHQRFGGVSRYFARLARELTELDVEVTMTCGLYVNEYVAEFPFAVGYRVPQIRRTAIVRRHVSRWWQSRVIRRLARDEPMRPTVIHKTWYDPELFDRRIPLIVTVHDLIPELFGGPLQPETSRKQLICENATQIIAISETTKRDLLNFYRLPPERVHVVLHGVDFEHSVHDSKDRILDRLVLLFVGSRRGYKNFRRLIEAVASSRLLRRNCIVQCCGGGTFTRAEVECIQANGLVGYFRQCSPSDRELRELYRRAHILVVPSLYEGFGLPVLEAMSQGCCVACSDRGALPEVAGDAAAYFDPSNPESIGAVLEKLAFDQGLQSVLREKGLARSRRFGWDSCAAATRAVYENALRTSA
jgi:glycosyltransferase involved in cell wall biosynthesis